MSGRVIHVTTELHPETPGGAGVVVDSLARRLGRTRGSLVVLLTEEPTSSTTREDVEVVHRVVTGTGFMKRAETAARVVADTARPGDRIEVQDFEGLGYLMLAHRGDLGLDRIPITVRFHGPYDLLAEAMDTAPSDWGVVRAMEAESYRMADAVLIPVPGHLETLVGRYDLEPERVLVAPPPIPPLPPSPSRRVDRAVFGVIGRLGEMKGSQDMVRAALDLLEEGRDLTVRFIGADGWSTTNSSTMIEWLRGLIGPAHQDSFEFVTGAVRDDLPELTADNLAIVVPSRFESFCLAAHEARHMGHPVVVPPLPAFEGLFTAETGALVYNGTVPGLMDALRTLVLNAGLALELAGRPVPEPGSPWPAYETDPEPRHPRSQSGLATAATQRVSAAWEDTRAAAAGPGLLQRIYQRLPEGLANVLRKAPRGLKERVKQRASWPAELERRQREARLRAVEERIVAGEFREQASPEVTVVIPVHDDVGFLDETLASVYEQTFDSWEIVLVDDGSTESGAVAYLDAMARPRVRVIRQENRGLPGARNSGMAVARGRYLVPLDSDDELERDFMRVMIDALEPHPQAAYAHCYTRLHHDVDAIWITRPFNPYWQLLGNGIVGCVLLRKEAWVAVGGYDETMARGNEDWELWLRLMEARWGQVQVPRVLFRYRKHGISMSVRTEAQFDVGRRMVRDRHPDLYDPETMRRFKRRWYPLVTAIGEGGDSGDDVEWIPDPERLVTTWGKFVVDTRGVDPPGAPLLATMAQALEGEPRAARAVTKGLPPLVMQRRWNLHDPGATPDRVIVVEDPTVGPEPALPTHVPRAGWSVPAELDDTLPVQRQVPEETGLAVDPARW
ncbi:MAG: glycosyltransferase [Actinobacteria bacterium]|nr:glycosyltransferase [Actinomycetota bacterium]